MKVNVRDHREMEGRRPRRPGLRSPAGRLVLRRTLLNLNGFAKLLEGRRPRRPGVLAMLLVALFAGPATAGDVILPIPMPQAHIDGAIFTERKPEVTMDASEWGEFTTEDVEVFRAGDDKFDAGMYRAGPNKFTVSGAYGVDEFRYFLKGGVKLTSSDGSVLHVNAGDAVVIPKEWTGVWETDGYTKIYVIYSPDKPIE